MDSMVPYLVYAEHLRTSHHVNFTTYLMELMPNDDTTDDDSDDDIDDD